MKRVGKTSLISSSLLIFFCSLTFSQSQETGAIQGTVMTPEGEPLPGVEVTISSPHLIGGSKSQITNQYGKYRFPALPIGTYEAEARLEGFTPQRRVDLRVSIQMTLTLDITLTVGSLEESVTVVAESPIIDVKDSQLSTSIMEKEFLMQLPSPRQFRRQIAYQASSVGERHATAYGASENLSNSFLIDGVKTNSSESGEPIVNLDYDSIEEIKMMGQGTNAEYDGFSGIIVSATIKSGSNNVASLGTFWFQLPGFHSENWNNYRDEDGELYLYQATWDSELDFHLNLGGPFIQDKLWWYISAKYSSNKVVIEDWDFETEYGWQSRMLGKITCQTGAKDRLFGTFDYALFRYYNIGAGPYAARETWASQVGWQYFWNVNYLHVFSSKTFLEAKAGGYNQDGKLDIDYNTPFRFDLGTEYLSGNFWEFNEDPRTRYQINAVISHHAEDFIGTHDFKFGGEFEYTYAKNYRGYPGGRGYLDFFGEPYLMSIMSPYKIDPKSKRTAMFLQDQWSVSDRITINWGIRMNIWRGSTSEDGTIFKPQTAWAPRFGVTFDLFGDHTTALKVHYGKYFHGIIGIWFGHWSYESNYAEYYWDEYEQDYVKYFEESVVESYTIDPDLKYPYVDNIIVGIERELGRDTIFGVSYITRSNKNFIDNVNISGMWNRVAWIHPDLGETFHIFERVNPGVNEKYVTNPYAGQGKDIGAAFEDIVPFTPTRKYWGLEFTFRKRFFNNWQFMAAYTYSRTTGSNDNSWGEYENRRTSSLGASVLYLNPNWSYNAEGTLTRDHPHIVKLAGSYLLPLEITLGLFYQYYSGGTYNRNIKIPKDIDPDSVGLYAEPLRIYGEEKGAFREPAQHNLDMRLEKFFTLGVRFRLGLLIDMFNIFNADTPTSLETRIERGRDPFGFVRGIRSPRTFRLGLHFEF
jgi:hypothetical protein